MDLNWLREVYVVGPIEQSWRSIFYKLAYYISCFIIAVRESAYILSGALKEGQMATISDNLKEVISDYMKSKPRRVDIDYEVNECTSNAG